MSRKEQLLRMAADAFEDGRNPFDHESLCEHKVTADECFELSEAIAIIIRGYLNVPKEIRHQVALCGSIDGSGTVDPEVALAFLRKQQALQKLGGVLGS